MLTGFDYARPEDPRSNSVLDRLAEVLDPAYVAPECQNRPQRMSRASDVYAAGVIAFQVLTGELPFASSTDQHQRGSALPSGPMTAAGLPQPLIDLLRRMCAQAARPRRRRHRPPKRWRPPPWRAPSGHGRAAADYRNLPEGYQLTRKYTVQRKIGSGTFGTVYQVYDSLADADRAVKIVDRDPNSPVARLQQEYRILLVLPPHPNVVRVESADYLDGQDVPYLVFEYLDGQDVSDLVKEPRARPRRHHLARHRCRVRPGVPARQRRLPLRHQAEQPAVDRPGLQDHRLQRGRAVVFKHVQGRRRCATRRRTSAASGRRARRS